jgi:serine/threonine protein kinase
MNTARATRQPTHRPKSTHGAFDNGRAVGIFHGDARLTPVPGTTDEPSVTENQPQPKSASDTGPAPSSIHGSGTGVPVGAPRAAPSETVLKLEDSNAGSTDAVGGSASGSGMPPTAQIAAGPGDSKSLSQFGDAGIGEGSTGGFDTLLGTLVVESGLVTAEEMELCNSLMRESPSAEDPRTLADLLLENDFLTQRQLSRIRNEFEARKSSQRIPGYRIQKKLGAGAMATVFLAHQLSLDRPVAIKVLPKKFSANAKFIERFYKEGRAAAKLNHPNIVAAYDVGQAGEHHYFVMEYVDGLTVYDKLVKDKRISEAEAIRITTQVAKALQHAHARGFIHRDIKPKNIMINSQGVVKLADLGLARAMSDKEAAKAEAGRAYGTPYYISPEQIRGEIKIGPQADIYGLGATLYHMVTGRVPFEGKNPSAVMHQHLKSELIPPDHVNPKISGPTAQVIEMMMAKNVGERYQNVNDLLHDLDLLAQGQPPHFARKNLDLSSVATAITDTIPVQPVVMEKKKREEPSLFDYPVFAVVLVLLGLSVVANIILAVFLAR